MTDYRAELQLLFDDAESFAEASLGHHYLWVAALNRAHAALAEQLVVPTDEELMDLAEEAWVPFAKSQPHPQGHPWDLVLARAVLARWKQP
jgi:hypothetical protein